MKGKLVVIFVHTLCQRKECETNKISCHFSALDSNLHLNSEDVFLQEALSKSNQSRPLDCIIFI